MNFSGDCSLRDVKRFSFSAYLNPMLGVAQVGTEIQFPPRLTQHCISIADNKIVFMLTNTVNNTQILKLDEPTVGRNTLLDLSKKFGFETIPHPLETNLLTGSLGFKHKDYHGNCFAAIQDTLEGKYILIYASRGSTAYEDDIFYIHGIWQIKS